MSDDAQMHEFTRKLFGRTAPAEATTDDPTTSRNVVSAEGRHHPGSPAGDDMRDFTRRLFGRDDD